jgi:hypothetical protein
VKRQLSFPRRGYGEIIPPIAGRAKPRQHFRNAIMITDMGLNPHEKQAIKVENMVIGLAGKTFFFFFFFCVTKSLLARYESHSNMTGGTFIWIAKKINDARFLLDVLRLRHGPSPPPLLLKPNKCTVFFGR